MRKGCACICLRDVAGSNCSCWGCWQSWGGLALNEVRERKGSRGEGRGWAGEGRASWW